MTRSEICRRLGNKGYANSRHSFMRTIDRLRKDLQAPVGYEDRPCASEPNGFATYWFYRDPSWTLKSFQMTEGTLFSLFVARQVVEQYAGHPLAQELNAVYEKLGETLNRKLTLSNDNLAPVSFFPNHVGEVNSVIWKAVLSSTVKRNMLKMTYNPSWAGQSGTSDERTINPYHIVNLNGVWFLVGSKSATDLSVRQYSVANIKKAEVLKASATIPDDFNIDEILDYTFGRFLGDPKQVVDVKLRFNKKIAPLISRAIVSRRQHLRILPDGRIELEFPASTAGTWPLYHVKGWVLSWGADCEVLAPDELKQLVREDLEKAAKPYLSTTASIK